MKYKYKKEKILVLFLILFTTTSLWSTIGVCATFDEASSTWSTNKGYSHYESRVDLQGDAVFENSSGSTEYAIFITGNNDYWLDYVSTRTIIYLFVSAHYYYEFDSGIGNYDEWGPVDPDLIKWESDWVYDQGGGIWDWEVSSIDYYCNGNDETSTSCYTTTNEDGVDQGLWRNLGYVYIYKASAQHRFDALIKFQIDNQEGEDYTEGRPWYNPDLGWYYQTITEIQVKLHYFYQQYTWWTWNTDEEHVHVLGDGSGYPDITSIPLVEGIVDGLRS